MTIGAVAGFSAAYKTGNLWIGLLSGMFFGMLWSLIMAWLSVTMRANQVIAGIALNILGAGTAVYVYRIIFGVQSLPPQVTPFAAVNIPVLSSLPVIGQIFFQHNILVYLSYVMVFVTWFILEKTKFSVPWASIHAQQIPRVSVWQVSVMQRYSSAVFMPVQQVHLCLLLI